MHTSAHPFFAKVSRGDTKLSAGSVTLPILYSDASVHGLFYSVAAKRAHAVLGPDTPFEPWTTGGRATVLMCSFEYRASTIGAYGEVGIGILVRKKGTRPSLFGYLRDMRSQPEAGLFIISLPVTTQAANDAGREIWGFPKYVTEIKTEFDRSSRRGGVSVVVPGEIELEAGPSRGPSTKGFPFVLVSVSRGRCLRTVVEVDHEVRWGLGAGVKLRTLGDGPTARVVRELGLDRSRALAAFRTDQMRSILPGGTDIGTAVVQASE